MIELFRRWYQRHFHDPQAAVLLLLLGLGLTLLLLAGGILAPLLVSVLLAYVLDGLVRLLSRQLPRALAFALVYALFAAGMAVLLFGLAPLLSQQLAELAARLPGMAAAAQRWLEALPQQYPDLISVAQVEQLLARLQGEALIVAQNLVRFSLDTVVDLLTLVVYVVLVPILVFFLLKDKERILAWGQLYLPARQSYSTAVWREMNLKVTLYLQGKLLEVLVVWLATYLVFVLFGLQYALLLSFLVGLSVIIPYVGAVAVTVPVALVALFQWGLGPEFAWLLAAYLVVQFLDGNLLVPLLFAEVVKLHPVAILAAILVFGGLWGVWGVLFAIPLASLIEVILRSWPRAQPG